MMIIGKERSYMCSLNQTKVSSDFGGVLIIIIILNNSRLNRDLCGRVKEVYV